MQDVGCARESLEAQTPVARCSASGASPDVQDQGALVRRRSRQSISANAPGPDARRSSTGTRRASHASRPAPSARRGCHRPCDRACRTMRVAMDQACVAVRAQEIVGRSGIDVHQKIRLVALGRLALLAQCKALSARARAAGRRERRPPVRLANQRTKRLVVVVVGAQRIAMREDELPGRQRQDVRIGQQARAAARHKGSPSRKSRLPCSSDSANTGGSPACSAATISTAKDPRHRRGNRHPARLRRDRRG
jgi:hypothetical protein